MKRPMDPNTEIFLKATTFFVCLFGAIGLWLPVGLSIHWAVGVLFP